MRAGERVLIGQVGYGTTRTQAIAAFGRLGVDIGYVDTTDPTAVALASRRPGERWLCLEQPERDGAALAALGSACTIETSGPERFRTVAAEWRRVAATAVVDDPAGLIAAGGFAFAPDGGGSPAWQPPRSRWARRPWCGVAGPSG